MIRLPGVRAALINEAEHAYFKNALNESALTAVLTCDKNRVGVWSFKGNFTRRFTLIKGEYGRMSIVLRTPHGREDVNFDLRTTEEVLVWPSVLITLLEARSAIKSQRDKHGWCTNITFKPDRRSLING